MADFIEEKFVKYIRKHSDEWLDREPAYLGSLLGIVPTGVLGVDYARLANGQEIKVRNNVVPQIFDTKIIVGHNKSNPSTWQVIATRETYIAPSSNYIAFHAPQHVFPAPDTVFANRKQLLFFTVLANPADPYVVRLYGGISSTKDGWVKVDGQDVDLESYIPETGAIYACIEFDSFGVVYVREGVTFESKEVADLADIAPAMAGRYHIADVLLFANMESVLDEYIFIPTPLGYNAADIAGDISNLRYQALVYETNVPDKTIAFPPWKIDGALATGTNMSGKWIAPEAGVVRGFLLLVDTPGSSGSTIADVNKNGSTIYTTTGNRPTFANTDSDPVESAEPDIVEFVKGDVFSIDLDAIATGATGLTLVPIANGYTDISLLTDIDGNLVYELQELESV